MRPFDAVVFDFDGTLFDTRPAIAHCIRRAFAQCGRPLPTHDAVMAAIKSGLPLQETLQSLDSELRNDSAALSAFVRTYRAIYLGEATSVPRPFEGVPETLQRLHAAGTKCLVVSNKGIAAIRQSLDRFGLGAWVDFVFGEEPGKPRKPDAAIVAAHILPRYTALQRRDILVVGDTEIDIMFARGSGVACCWAAYGYGEPDRCRSLTPDYEIADIAELPGLVHARS